MGQFGWGNTLSARPNSQEGFYRPCLDHAGGRATGTLGRMESWAVSNRKGALARRWPQMWEQML